MPVFLNAVTTVLFIGGWCLITLTLADIFVTARFALTGNRKNIGLNQYYQTANFRIFEEISDFIKRQKIRRFLLWSAGFLIPFMHYIIWNAALIAGFSFLYLGLFLQTQNEIFGNSLIQDIFSAFWLSFTVFVHIAPYEIDSTIRGVYLLANIQFYLGFLFYGFICLHLLILRNKVKQLQPFLYRLKHKIKKPYSPLNLSAHLQQNYGSNELLFILQDWEIWAVKMSEILKANPSLIYARTFSERWSWLSSLNIILDAAAAISVTSDGLLKRQAGQTFAVSRHALFEIAGHFGILPNKKNQICYEIPAAEIEDDVLSAEIIYDLKDKKKREYEMLAVWQFTYRTILIKMANQLDVKTLR